MLYTVRGLDDKAEGVVIRVRILTLDEPRIVKTRDGIEHRVVDARVGDGTGTIVLTLWDDRASQVKVGDIIDIINGYVNRFKGRLILNVGKFGKLEMVEDPTFPPAEAILTRYHRRYVMRPRGSRPRFMK